MNTKMMLLGVGAVALTAGLALAPQASAQAIATANPLAAMYKSTAFVNAMTAIKAANKTQLDQADALEKEAEPLEIPFDANKDGQLDDQEQAKMRASTSWPAISAKLGQAQNLRIPALRAQAYVEEQLSPKLNQAYKNVVGANKVSLVIRPDAVITADANADITDEITAEINKLQTTPLLTTPPANWQPGGGSAPAAAPAKGPLPSGVPGGTAPAPAPATPGKKPAGR